MKYFILCIAILFLGCKDESCWSFKENGLLKYEGCNASSRLVISDDDYVIYLESETGDVITIKNGSDGPEVTTEEVGVSVGNFLISKFSSDVIEFDGLGTRNGYVIVEIEFGTTFRIEWWDLICIEEN